MAASSLNSICTVSLPPVREQVRGRGEDEVKGERRGMWQHSATLTMGREKTTTDGHRRTDGKEEGHGGGKFPPVFEQRLWMTEQAWDKGNSLPAGGWELFIQWAAAIETERERETAWRRDGLKRNRTQQRGKPERSGQTGRSSVRLSILSQSEKKKAWPNTTFQQMSFSHS